MADRVIQRNDTAARWQSINPILATGEIGIEIDGAKGYKIGDGKTRWNDLPYPANPTNVVQELGNNENAVPSQKLVTEKLSELGSKVSNIYPLFTYINNIITDKESSYKIGYTGTDGTENTNNSEWRKFDVSVESGESYSLSGGRIMICFFDSNMNVIGGGIDSQSDRVITIPASASLMRVSFQIANKDVLAIVKSDVIVTVNDLVSNPTERLNVYNKEYINEESKKIKKNSDEIATLMPMFDFSGINMFDASKGEVGLFTTSTGSTASNANWRYTEYEVTEGLSYSIYGGRNMVCFYVSPKNATVVSGGYESDISRVVTVPNGATFMRVSSLIENDNEMCITQSDVLVSKEDTGAKPSKEFSVYSKRDVDSMFMKVTVYTIGADYSNIKIALEDIYAKKPSFKNRFVLRVPSGVYDIRSLFSPEELLTTKGVFVPPFTKVVGIGNPEDVVLTWFNEESNSVQAVLNIDCTAELENITLHGKYLRYALHDDWNIAKWDNSSREVYWEEPFIDFGWIRVIKNCIFKVENSPVRPAWGAGNVNGSKWRFENCRFESDKAYAISCHNNGGYTSMPTMEFISCDFVVPSSEGRFGRLISLTTGANGINNIAIFKGCRHSENTKLALLEEQPTSTWGMGCLWKVKGYANKFTNEDCLINVTDGEDYTSNLELM